MTASSRSSCASIRPRRSIPRTAAEITPCNRFEPDRFWVTLRPLARARAASIRQVVVLPLLPVTITLRVSVAAPTFRRMWGSIRRATLPGKLVPPPNRSTRHAVPTALPAPSASARRACPEGVTCALPAKDPPGERLAIVRTWRHPLPARGLASGSSSGPRVAAARLLGRGGARHHGLRPRWLGRALHRGRNGGHMTEGRSDRGCLCLPGTPAPQIGRAH